MLAPVANVPPATEAAPPSATEKTAEKAPATTEVPASQPAPKQAETKSALASPTKSAEMKSAPTKPATAVENFVVQLAAYAEPGAAHALERRLKTGGFPAYTETLKTSHGALTRVRVGPFPTREAAEGERAKLKDAGENGMVTPLH